VSMVRGLSEDPHHQAIRDEMASLGERLLSAGRTEEALQVFYRIVQIYPESASARALLGEFYLATGDGERARERFVQSLELRPDNPEVKAKLLRLGGAK
jgi:Flp pilus assembly protein TadD